MSLWSFLIWLASHLLFLSTIWAIFSFVHCNFIVSLLFACDRFIQMAPQYFFYNLPPSESKDVLQHIIDHGSAAPSKGVRKSQTPNSPASAEQPHERCTIQWLGKWHTLLLRYPDIDSVLTQLACYTVTMECMRHNEESK